MYLSRPVLALLIIVYLLFLLSVDWINSTGGWYRPFLLAFVIIGIAAWLHRGQDVDEL